MESPEARRTDAPAERVQRERTVAVEVVSCNNCGSSKHRPVGEGRDHEYPRTTDTTFRFVRCHCGLVYLNPRPATAALDTIYPPAYYAYQIVERRSKATSGSGTLLGRYMDAQAVQRLRPYARLVKGPRPHRILDIGCGDGTVLNQWRRAWDGAVETHGVEMNEHAARIASALGHVVIPKRIEDAALPGGSFDVVFSFHVIEHVEDPTSFMRAIAGTLKDDGYLLIDTPNVDTVDFRLFGKHHWGAYHFPRHWNLYDPTTFRALAEKTGFEVVRIEYMPSAVFWVWTMHSMLFDRSRRLADALFPPVNIFLGGSPWIWSLLGAFTALDLVNLRLTGRTANMRLLLRKKSAAAKPLTAT
jgi:2-polyprenyl-3-methyl-5-hydroxy-6-metoxy-1,4-benzoquinol methylase